MSPRGIAAGKSKRRRGAAASAAEPVATTPWSVWLAGAAVAIAAIVAFGNSVWAPFVLDDRLAILENTTLLRLWPITDALFAPRESPLAGRPLVNLSFAANYAIAAFDPRLYHAGNVAIHAACALVLWGVIRQTLGLPRVRGGVVASATWMATACALVWAVHPLNSEAVDYVTQRTELMMGLAYLLTLYCSIRAISVERPFTWQTTAVLACGCGMACKEPMVTAPLIVMLYDGAYGYESVRDAIARRWRFYLGLMSTWVVLVALLRTGPRVHSAGFSSGVSPWTYLLNQSEMIVRYLRLSVWPQPLVVSYGYPRLLALHEVWLPMTLVAILLAAAVILYVRKPQLGFLGLWFFVTLAPTSSFVPIATEVGAERRMYLPLAAVVVGAALLVLWLGSRVLSRVSYYSRGGAAQAAAGALVTIVCVALASASYARGREYQSSLTLTSTLVERWPTGHSHGLLATDLAAAGRHDEAIAHLRQALDGEPRAYFVLGVELFNQGKFDEANRQLQEFVRLEPLLIEVVDARDMMGRIAATAGRPTDAEAHYRAALGMNPRHLDSRVDLADALFAQGRYAEAISEYRRYLLSRPGDEHANGSLGVSLQRSGQTDEAIGVFRHMLESNPDHAVTNRNLAAMLLDKGEYADALLYARRAAQAAPNDALAHDLVGIALTFQAKIAEALVEFEQALRINPSDALAREHYAEALHESRRLGLQDRR